MNRVYQGTEKISVLGPKICYRLPEDIKTIISLMTF